MTDFGIFCVHNVKLFELLRRRSFEIDDRWCINRRSVLEYSCAEGGGKTFRSGYGKLPVCCQRSNRLSAAGVKTSGNCSGLPLWL
jgi:hypothetical protein